MPVFSHHLRSIRHIKVLPLRIFAYLFILFSLCCASLANARLLQVVPESVEAAARSILDPQSGQIIAEYNSEVQRSPASLTKMMVAYIALKEIENGKLNRNEILTATPVVKWSCGMNLRCI